MTVCIAAVCEDGKHVVVAADRMFTAAAPVNLEFETEEQKIEVLASSCVGLMSGATVVGTEVLDETKRKLGGSQSPMIADVARIVEAAYITVRGTKAHQAVVVPTLGPDFAAAQARGATLPAYLQPQAQVYQQLVVQMNQYNINLDIIVAGIDTTKAHIGRITHPGTVIWLDKLGYDAIGSGGIHALTRLYLGGQTRKKGLVETVYAVYDAKRASEVAPGVGKETDMAIIDASSTRHCSADVLKVLQKVHEDTNTKLTPDLKTLTEALEKEGKK